VFMGAKGSDKERQSCANGSDTERSRSSRNCNRSLSLQRARSKNRSPPTNRSFGIPRGIARPKSYYEPGQRSLSAHQPAAPPPHAATDALNKYMRHCMAGY
jgi:hypothetical protein